MADALTIEGGPDVVWLGAALIFGAGSTSFEMLRYVGDRFPVIPIPKWMDNPIDPISIRDVLHYLVAAADAGQVPAGAYDISGPETTSYHALLKTYARVAGKWHTALPVRGLDTALASRVTAVALPVPDGLAADLVESLDHPMRASGTGLRDLVPDPPGGRLRVEDAMSWALSSRRPRPVNALSDLPPPRRQRSRLGGRRCAANPAARTECDTPHRTAQPRLVNLVPAPSPVRCGPAWTF